MFVTRIGDRLRAFPSAIPVFPVAKAVFKPPEMGEHIIVSPTGRAHISPLIKFLRLSAHKKHAVDGGRTAHDAALRQGNRTNPGPGAGLCCKRPDHLWIGDGLHEARGHSNEGVGGGKPGLHDAHRMSGIGQCGRDHAAC